MRSTFGLLRTPVGHTVGDLVDKRIKANQSSDSSSDSSDSSDDSGRNVSDQNYITASTTRPLHQKPGDVWAVLKH